MVRDILCIVFCILLAFILLLLAEIEIGFQDDTSKVRKKDNDSIFYGSFHIICWSLYNYIKFIIGNYLRLFLKKSFFIF